MALQQSEILNSWKEISTYIGRGVRTVQRWEKDFGLPVRRPGGHLRGSVFAVRDDIDEWLHSRNPREAARHEGATRATMDKLQENSKRLMERCTTLMNAGQELASTLDRINQTQDRLRKADRKITVTPESRLFLN